MLYTIEQLRQTEQAAFAATASGALMRAAGLSAARSALQLLTSTKASVLVLAGPGNNGGDAFETAVHLATAGHQVDILHFSASTPLSEEAQQAMQNARACSALHWLDSNIVLKQTYELVVDGLFGIGQKQRQLPPLWQKHITHINSLACPVLAIDVPSGLNANTGNLLGDDAITATHTITFIGDKIGLHTGNGRDYAGQVDVDDLGVAPGLFPVSTTELNHPTLFPAMLTARRHNSNKGSNGSVVLIGGATGMQGALILAARAALFSGAGKTIAGFIDSPVSYDPQQPEIMCRAAHNLSLSASSVVVIGPGLGNSVASFELLSRMLLGTNPLVIDADALNLMAQQPALHALCSGRDQFSTLLTPHPLEASRLLGCTLDEVQADRISSAKKLARRYQAVVILKGSGSVIAHPDGRTVINPTGNPALASGGTGDVLTGVCGALLAQHGDNWQTALAATYVHGAAADQLVRQGTGPVGVSASELLVEIRRLLNNPLSK